jgi:RNA polymerase sigma factor (sigma-70 family)
MIEDTELLRRYAHDRSEEAFAELVRRHVHFVYSAALRQTSGDAADAQDITQAVFTALARKAEALASHRVLVGWLFTSTRFAAAKIKRGEQRRRVREQEAHMMQQLTQETAGAVDWDQLRPVLDGALHALSESDREAVLLRFWEGRPFPEVGAKLSVSADAARLRVDRALEKMRAALGRHGVTSTTAALAVALANQPVVALPAGLAASVTSGALAGAGAVGIGTFLTMTKLPLGLAGLLVIAGTTSYVVQARTAAGLHSELASLQPQNQQIASLQADNLRQAKAVAEADRLRQENAALAQAIAEPGASLTTDRLQSGDAVPNAAKVFDLKSVDRHPIPKSQARPVYPFEMKHAGVNGDVQIEFVVDTNGNVTGAHVLRSSRSEFEAPALTAVQQWKFDPGEKDGKACNTRMQVPIRFTMNKDEPMHHDH